MLNIPEGLDWLATNQPAVLALIRVLLFVVPILIVVPGCIWWERRLLSWMQDRIGPNRTGTISKNFPIKFLRGKKTFGLLQPIADGVKLFFKEDVTPSTVDRVIYFVAPAVALFPAFAVGGTLPWGPTTGVYGHLTPIWNPEIGLLFMLAISSLGVYGVVLGGYASNNKYSLLGGLRSSAQLISYELAMSMALACIVLPVGSLRMTEIVTAQEKPLWGIIPQLQNWFILTPYGFAAFVIFLVCMVAETNRAPFDLPEAENEIIAGYHTEYSSMKFAVFFMGEYATMFIFGGVLGAVFLGGHNILPVNFDALGAPFMTAITYWLAPITFLTKCIIGITFFIWLRGSLPRLRYDQLMGLGWKVMLPAAVLNFIVVMCWMQSQFSFGTQGMVAASVGAVLIVVMIYKGLMNSIKLSDTGMDRRTIDMVSGLEEGRRVVEMVK